MSATGTPSRNASRSSNDRRTATRARSYPARSARAIAAERVGHRTRLESLCRDPRGDILRVGIPADDEERERRAVAADRPRCVECSGRERRRGIPARAGEIPGDQPTAHRGDRPTPAAGGGRAPARRVLVGRDDEPAAGLVLPAEHQGREPGRPRCTRDTREPEVVPLARPRLGRASTLALGVCPGELRLPVHDRSIAVGS